jgi:hypothetical protein
MSAESHASALTESTRQRLSSLSLRLPNVHLLRCCGPKQPSVSANQTKQNLGEL